MVDGGKRWVDRTFPCLGLCTRPLDLIRIRFSSPKAGWIVGERGVLYRTTDGGFNWVKQSSKSKANLFGLSFPDSAQGWASGDRGTILRISGLSAED